MGGAISRIFSPGSAKFMASNTNSALLKSALQNYIKAVNNLNNNARTENKLVAMMNDTRIGLTNSYKKRIANSIASIVAKVPRVAAKAAEAAAGAAPVTPAAVAVNNLANQINNLNRRITGIKNLAAVAGGPGGPTNSQVAAFYRTKGYNNAANRAINTAGKYASIWAAINALKTAGAAPPPAAVNNRFKNMNINALVNSAAQSLTMSNENKAKLKAAMNAKINTLSENSMNRVRLVNATRNLN